MYAVEEGLKSHASGYCSCYQQPGTLSIHAPTSWAAVPWGQPLPETRYLALQTSSFSRPDNDSHAKSLASMCLNGCTGLVWGKKITAHLWVQQGCAWSYKSKSNQWKIHNSVSCWIFISMLCNCISINNCVQYATIMTSIRSFLEKIRPQTLYCTDPNFFFPFSFSFYFFCLSLLFYLFIYFFFGKLSNLQQ